MAKVINLCNDRALKRDISYFCPTLTIFGDLKPTLDMLCFLLVCDYPYECRSGFRLVTLLDISVDIQYTIGQLWYAVKTRLCRFALPQLH